MTTVKIAYRGDVRRVSVTDYASLVKQITTAYRIDNFVIKYVDEDDDRISVGNDFELADALRLNQSQKMLKLLVFVPKQAPAEPPKDDLEQQLLQHIQQLTEKKREPEKKEEVPPEEKPATPAPENKESEGEEEEDKEESPEPEPAVVDHHTQCANCAKPIVGILYRCSVCRGVQLCAGCEEREVHDATHTLIKIRQQQRQPAPPMKKRCCWGKLKLVKKLALPVIGLLILRHLPFILALLGFWAVGEVCKKRRRLLSECSECTHTEGCHVGKVAKKLKRFKDFKNLRCTIFCKFALVVGCVLARVCPLWLVLPPMILALVCSRKLKRFMRKGCREQRNGRPADLKEMVQNLAQRWNQLCAICCGPRPAAAVSAAVAAAATAAMNEVQRMGDGIQIPVAVPPTAAGPAFEQQTRLLREMGFQITPALQQLLIKHNGNLQAVLPELVELTKKQS